jgi:hypothetical protein
MKEAGQPGDTLRPRLQLSLGATAELGAEVASASDRRLFDGVTRDTGRAIMVILYPPPPNGPELSSMQARITSLRELGHGVLEVPLACGDLDGCTWVADGMPSTPMATQLASGGMPLAQAVSAIRDLTRVLAAMHRRDITHGSIDLETVGVDARGTRLGGMGRSLGRSRRDDLDALGLVAWALLSGEPRPTSIRPLSAVRRGVSSNLDVLCAALLAVDSRDRPQRAEAVLDLLDAVPTRRIATPGSVVDGGTHDVRSRPITSWLLVGLAVLVLIILLVLRS